MPSKKKPVKKKAPKTALEKLKIRNTTRDKFGPGGVGGGRAKGVKLGKQLKSATKKQIRKSKKMNQAGKRRYKK